MPDTKYLRFFMIADIFYDGSLNQLQNTYEPSSLCSPLDVEFQKPGFDDGVRIELRLHLCTDAPMDEN